MAEAFQFELVSPERLLVSEQVEFVVIPGAEGEMTVMANHAPVMTTIKPGVVTVKTAAGATERYVRVRRLRRHPAVRLHAARRIGGRGRRTSTATISPAASRMRARTPPTPRTIETRTRAEEYLGQLTTLEAAHIAARLDKTPIKKRGSCLVFCLGVPSPSPLRGGGAKRRVGWLRWSEEPARSPLRG